jgi:DNA-binding response OmpR family regulator
LLRRSSGKLANYDDGTLSIEPGSRKIVVHGLPVSLGHREWLVLAELVRSPVPVAREELLARAWGRDAEPSALEKAISRLKVSLGATDYIKTVNGFGYFFAYKPSI